MKICQKCGTKNFDIYENCEKCGCQLLSEMDSLRERELEAFIPARKIEPVRQEISDEEMVEYHSIMSQPNIAMPRQAGKDSVASRAAKLFLVCDCAAKGIAFLVTFILWLESLGGPEVLLPFVHLIMLGSIISMGFSIWVTNMYFKRIKEGLYIGMIFKVCVLLLINFFAGFVMICDIDHD